MDMRRQLLGAAGLLAGFLLYPQANGLPAPWNDVTVGAVFAALGLGAYLYARGERWIQALGGVLLLYGLLRMTVLH